MQSNKYHAGNCKEMQGLDQQCTKPANAKSALHGTCVPVSGLEGCMVRQGGNRIHYIGHSSPALAAILPW